MAVPFHAESASPGPVQYTWSRPRSASGSPRVQISQSSTAITAAVVVDHAVVEAVVAVDEGGWALIGDPFQQCVVHAVDEVEFTRLALVPLAVPTLQLTFDVSVVAAEVGEARLFQVDGVDRRHRVDDRTARRTLGLFGEDGVGRCPIAQHVAVDEAHDVERRLVDRQVVAVPLDRWHRHRRRLQAGEDAMFATHVVGAGQYVAERRATQHEARAVGTGDAVRQVGVPAGDRVEPERCDGTGDARDQPVGDALDVDPRYGAHLAPRVASARG